MAATEKHMVMCHIQASPSPYKHRLQSIYVYPNTCNTVLYQMATGSLGKPQRLRLHGYITRPILGRAEAPVLLTTTHLSPLYSEKYFGLSPAGK